MPSTSVKTESTKLPDQSSTSPVLKKPRLNFEFKSSKLSESSNSLAQSGGSNSSNTSTRSVQSSGYSSSFNKTSQGGKSNVVRKFSSFDSPPKEKKLIAKFKSDTHISLPSDKKSKPICTKEEIQRKKMEALAKRKLS